MWYEATPTVWAHDGYVTWINVGYEEMRKSLPGEAAGWVEAAKRQGAWVSVCTRAGLVAALEDVDARAIEAAGIAAACLDVAPPATGTKDEKEAAVAAKLAAIVPCEEYVKAEALVAELAEVVDGAGEAKDAKAEVR